jgi:hypothetical protein
MVAGFTTEVKVSPKSMPVASTLREVAHHPSHLVAAEAAVRVELMFEHPFPSDDVCPSEAWNEPPSVVGL